MGEKKGFFGRLVSGLTKTRDNIVSGIDSIFNGFSGIDDDFYEELEEVLIMADLGINATTAIIPIIIASVFSVCASFVTLSLMFVDSVPVHVNH